MAKLGARVAQECGLAATYTGVSLIGFAVDATMLHLLLYAGAAPAWARVISLLSAMQVTFVINGRHVFRVLEWRTLPRQWWRYMVSNGLGNSCNYWIFVTMVSTHWPVIAVPMVALSTGSTCAWLINFLSARFFVFLRVEETIKTVREATHGPRSGP